MFLMSDATYERSSCENFDDICDGGLTHGALLLPKEAVVASDGVFAGDDHGVLLLDAAVAALLLCTLVRAAVVGVQDALVDQVGT
jgi:hypothetical protein